MDNGVNADLILREKLAIERTSLANDRTLLSFIRTSLYFSIAGISINSVIIIANGWILEIGFFAISILLLIVGIIKYRSVWLRIKDSKIYVGLNEGRTSSK